MKLGVMFSNELSHWGDRESRSTLCKTPVADIGRDNEPVWVECADCRRLAKQAWAKADELAGRDGLPANSLNPFWVQLRAAAIREAVLGITAR
jgi:hypothetical protein